ncbi:putative ABC transport system transmembrane protein [Euzebya pacifica]|uniref:Putative ABC transport system transmembrane protein n=1 Tax=Euzebya pacifica TaxID=1608957 RepID=A0A346Y3N9_9ACTN|nr:ABC transporter permease [Euzebya pacifica]AXV09086.1 putative ABC transport system transmembrane protein [Euzebya pacifica]
MRIAIRELQRQPGRFVPVTAALTLLVVLLLVLGGFLDGLEGSQTGAYRAHDGLVLVFADSAELQLQRSVVQSGIADELDVLDDVDAVGRLGRVDTTAAPQGTDDVEDVAVFGYELGTDVLPAPSEDGAVVDATLAELTGIEVGDVLEIGPAATPVTVAELVDDLTQGSPTVWLPWDQWGQVATDAAPADVLPDGASQALALRPTGSPADLTGTSLAEGVEAVTPEDAILALDVVQQQSSTFEGIIGVTFAVTLLVIALFFALIVLERVGLYAVLKALGAGTRDLLTGLAVQAVAISAVALVTGIVVAFAFTGLLPADLPIRILPARVGLIAGGTVFTALLGSLLTLRRIVRIDPASAIG